MANKPISIPEVVSFDVWYDDKLLTIDTDSGLVVCCPIPSQRPAGMDPIDWDVLMRRLSGVTAREIGAAIGVSSTRIYQRERRAVKWLRLHALKHFLPVRLEAWRLEIAQREHLHV